MIGAFHTVKNNWKSFGILFGLFAGTTTFFSEIEYHLGETPQSTWVNFYRSKIFGNPFRNYINLQYGQYLKDETHPYGYYLSPDLRLTFHIPQFLNQPGLEITEINSRSTMVDGKQYIETKLIIKDYIDQVLVCKSKAIPTVLKDNEQSTYTPVFEILKGCSYKFIERMILFDSFKVKKLEQIDEKMVFIQYYINDKKKACLWFFNKGNLVELEIISDSCDLKKELISICKDINQKIK